MLQYIFISGLHPQATLEQQQKYFTELLDLISRKTGQTVNIVYDSVLKGFRFDMPNPAKFELDLTVLGNLHSTYAGLLLAEIMKNTRAHSAAFSPHYMVDARDVELANADLNIHQCNTTVAAAFHRLQAVKAAQTLTVEMNVNDLFRPGAVSGEAVMLKQIMRDTAYGALLGDVSVSDAVRLLAMGENVSGDDVAVQQALHAKVLVMAQPLKVDPGLSLEQQVASIWSRKRRLVTESTVAEMLELTATSTYQSGGASESTPCTYVVVTGPGAGEAEHIEWQGVSPAMPALGRGLEAQIWASVLAPSRGALHALCCQSNKVSAHGAVSVTEFTHWSAYDNNGARSFWAPGIDDNGRLPLLTQLHGSPAYFIGMTLVDRQGCPLRILGITRGGNILFSHYDATQYKYIVKNMAMDAFKRDILDLEKVGEQHDNMAILRRALKKRVAELEVKKLPSGRDYTIKFLSAMLEYVEYKSLVNCLQGAGHAEIFALPAARYNTLLDHPAAGQYIAAARRIEYLQQQGQSSTHESKYLEQVCVENVRNNVSVFQEQLEDTRKELISLLKRKPWLRHSSGDDEAEKFDNYWGPQDVAPLVEELAAELRQPVPRPVQAPLGRVDWRAVLAAPARSPELSPREQAQANARRDRSSVEIVAAMSPPVSRSTTAQQPGPVLRTPPSPRELNRARGHSSQGVGAALQQGAGPSRGAVAQLAAPSRAGAAAAAVRRGGPAQPASPYRPPAAAGVLPALSIVGSRAAAVPAARPAVAGAPDRRLPSMFHGSGNGKRT